MKRRLPPRLPDYMRLELTEAPHIKAGIAAVRTYPDAVLAGYTEDEFLYIQDAVNRIERVGSYSPSHFLKAMRETQVVTAMPRVTDPVVDLFHKLQHPEVLDMWAQWRIPRGDGGPHAAWTGSRAVLTMLAALGVSSHVDDNYWLFRRDRSFQQLFAWLETRASESAKIDAEPLLLASYSRTTDHFKHLAAALGDLPLQTNLRMIEEIAALLRPAPVGARALIDGTDAKAWVKQMGRRGNEEAELEDVGARLIVYRGRQKYAITSQADLEPDGERLVTLASAKFWNGWYLVALVEQLTLLPLVWTLVPADWDEAQRIKALLELLYRHWPDCPLEIVVGDAAWDEDWAVRWCMLGYGIHLIARRTPTHADVKRVLSFDESASIAEIDGFGRLICRRHQLPLLFDHAHFPSRGGLVAGEEAKEHLFRIRARCEHGASPDDPDDPHCGVPGVHAMRWWSALSAYPHYMEGSPRRHAMRLALLARRNGCETLFSAIKVANGLALASGNRTRIRNARTIYSLISLALMFRTAFVLADLRAERGLLPPPPADLVAAAGIYDKPRRTRHAA